MNSSATPNFFVVLDLLIQAFHLDHEDPDLRGGGPFQHQLSGRRFDIKDRSLQRLVWKFGSAVLRSRVLPLIEESLRWDASDTRSDDVARLLGTASSLPPCTGDREDGVAARLSWLAGQHEVLLRKARSQDLGTGADPAFALMPVMRFVWHHLTFAVAALLCCGYFGASDLDGQTPGWTWGMEKPTSTPMRAACSAAGLTRGELTKELARSDPDRPRGWNVKTLDNLWNGGPSHPTFDSLAMVAELLCPGDQAVLAAWRRWYGLRELARKFASNWGWEWLGGCLGTTVAHALTLAQSLKRSTLAADERRVVASVGLWAGWRPQIARSLFGSLSRLAGDEPHPTLRLDYRAIEDGSDSLRIEDCVAQARGIERLPQELERRGQRAEDARRDALHLAWMWQGDLTQFAHLHPVARLVDARHRRDWRAAEDAARALVQLRPEYVDNHYVLVEALAHRGRFEAALTVIREAEARFPSAPSLAMAEILTLMLRGEQKRSHTDFEAARDKLLACAPADSEWEVHLLLADCHLALGDWEAALMSSRLVAEHNVQCGEARAIASICCAKLGKRQPENKAAEHAVRRGEHALLEELHRRDAAGELGSASLLPVPRWHRLSVQPDGTVHP